MLRGLIKACEKRPVPLKTLEDMCFDIEKELRNQGVSEVKSELVGEMVMDVHYHFSDKFAFDFRYALVSQLFFNVKAHVFQCF